MFMLLLPLINPTADEPPPQGRIAALPYPELEFAPPVGLVGVNMLQSCVRNATNFKMRASGTTPGGHMLLGSCVIGLKERRGATLLLARPCAAIAAWWGEQNRGLGCRTGLFCGGLGVKFKVCGLRGA